MCETDILCLQEHHLFAECDGFLSTLGKNFKEFTRFESCFVDGLRVRKGGISILWKSSVDYAVKKLPNIGNERIQVIEIGVKKHKNIFLINVYMPSVNNPHEDYMAIFYELMNIYTYLTTKGIVVTVGDFNTSITLGYRAIHRAIYKHDRTRELEHFMLTTNQVSLVTHMVCNGPLLTYFPYSGAPGTQIDHIMIQNEFMDMVQSVQVHDDCTENTSDHNPLSVTIRCNVPRFEISNRCVYRWDKVDTTLYREMLEGSVISKDLINKPITCNKDIDVLYNDIVQIITEVSEICVPKSQYRPYLKPYWNENLKELHRHQKKLRQI